MIHWYVYKHTTIHTSTQQSTQVHSNPHKHAAITRRTCLPAPSCGLSAAALVAIVGGGCFAVTGKDAAGLVCAAIVAVVVGVGCDPNTDSPVRWFVQFGMRTIWHGYMHICVRVNMYNTQQQQQQQPVATTNHCYTLHIPSFFTPASPTPLASENTNRGGWGAAAAPAPVAFDPPCPPAAACGAGENENPLAAAPLAAPLAAPNPPAPLAAPNPPNPLPNPPLPGAVVTVGRVASIDSGGDGGRTLLLGSTAARGGRGVPTPPPCVVGSCRMRLLLGSLGPSLCHSLGPPSSGGAGAGDAAGRAAGVWDAAAGGGAKLMVVPPASRVVCSGAGRAFW